jgi:hypothetical protein
MSGESDWSAFYADWTNNYGDLDNDDLFSSNYLFSDINASNDINTSNDTNASNDIHTVNDINALGNNNDSSDILTAGSALTGSNIINPANLELDNNAALDFDFGTFTAGQQLDNDAFYTNQSLDQFLTPGELSLSGNVYDQDSFTANDFIAHQQQAVVDQPIYYSGNAADEHALDAEPFVPFIGSENGSAAHSPVAAERLLNDIHSPASVNERRSPPLGDSQRTFTKSPSPEQDQAADQSNGQFGQQSAQQSIGQVSQHPLPATTSATGPQQKPPLYRSYQGTFQTSAEAKAHRKHTRKAGTMDKRLANVKANKRFYWVKCIYESMIDRSRVLDGDTSTHYKRFCGDVKVIDEDDLEAAAHQVFDQACIVHEAGWHRPKLYHKEASRGKLVDPHKGDVEGRLASICEVLKQNKASCNDALQGGLTLAKLVYNPHQRLSSKAGNNDNNQWKKLRLNGVKGLKGRGKQSGTGSTNNTQYNHAQNNSARNNYAQDDDDQDDGDYEDNAEDNDGHDATSTLTAQNSSNQPAAYQGYIPGTH